MTTINHLIKLIINNLASYRLSVGLYSLDSYQNMQLFAVTRVLDPAVFCQ